MDFQNLFAVMPIGKINRYAPVESAWSKKRRIEHVWTVCCSHDNHFFIRLKSIHFDKDLVQCLLSLVISPANACSSDTADRVYLVDENYCRRRILCHFKKITDSRCSDSD